MTVVLVTGAGGQLGRCLRDTTADLGQDMNVSFLTRDQLELTCQSEIQTCVEKLHPGFIINAAAFTAVDKAEEDRETAYLVNRDAPKYLAEAARKVGAGLIHISTDFVFDGKHSTPYSPGAPTHPLGVYGDSKLEGEKQIRKILAHNSMIIRTAWVYAEHGNNFVKTMLRLMAEKPSLNVVNDQVGCPTYARGLALMIWSILKQERFPTGIYHWTDEGGISWYDFACAIQEEALALGLLDREIAIHPIPASEYPTPATRPAYSVLDSSTLQALVNCKGIDWRKNLQEMLGRYSKMVK